MNIETNKIAGAVFGSLLFVVGVNVIAGGLFAPHKPAVPGYDLPAPEEAAAGGGAAAAAPAEPLPVLLASADSDQGSGRRPRNAPPATPSKRAGRTRSDRTSTASSDAPSPRTRASTTRRA